MFKSKAKEVWAFDAEWVPDPEAGRLLYGLPDTLTDREVVQEMWHQNGATEDDPMPYLKTIMCRVVSVASVSRRENSTGDVKLSLHTLPKNPNCEEDRDESVILQQFLTVLGERKRQIVGFNSQDADLKIFFA